MGQRGHTKGLDLISLGPGEGGKEVLILREIVRRERLSGHQMPWLSLTLADVSIALLLLRRYRRPQSPPPGGTHRIGPPRLRRF